MLYYPIPVYINISCLSCHICGEGKLYKTTTETSLRHTKTHIIRVYYMVKGMFFMYGELAYLWRLVVCPALHNSWPMRWRGDLEGTPHGSGR